MTVGLEEEAESAGCGAAQGPGPGSLLVGQEAGPLLDKGHFGGFLR